VRKRVFALVLPLAVGAAAIVAVSSAVGKTGGLQTLPSSSCGSVQFKGSGSPKYLIASDLPLQGAGRAQTTQMTQAVNFILAGQGYKAGNYSVGYQSCDDSTAQAGAWDASKCTANAQAYAGDATVLGVIGTFNSGCAKLEIPILNRAPNGPLAEVSPANTYLGLTKTGPGTAVGEPGIYYPTKKRNYARVVAPDDYQGSADALWMKQKGVKSVFILTDNQTYGKGIATLTQKAAKKVGIKVVGFQAWDAKASSYEALGASIKQTGAQAVFFGGIVCNNGGKLVKDVRAAVGGSVKFFGPDGFTPFDAVTKGAGSAANGMYVTVAGPSTNKLGAVGQKFIKDFTAFQHRKVDPYSVYAAQAAIVVLGAIARSNGTRASVVDQVFKTNIANSILGKVTIGPSGDTQAGVITVYQLPSGNPVAAITPPVAFVKSLH